MNFTAGDDNFRCIGMVGNWFVVGEWRRCNHIGGAIGEGTSFKLLVGEGDGIVEVGKGGEVHVIVVIGELGGRG